MLPNMAEVLDDFLQPVKTKIVTVTTVDFVPTETIVETDILAVVQVAQKEKLNPQAIDWSKRYLQVHSKEPLDMRALVEYQGKDYKVFELNDYSDYGYYEAICEEVK